MALNSSFNFGLTSPDYAKLIGSGPIKPISTTNTQSLFTAPTGRISPIPGPTTTFGKPSTGLGSPTTSPANLNQGFDVKPTGVAPIVAPTPSVTQTATPTIRPLVTAQPGEVSNDAPAPTTTPPTVRPIESAQPGEVSNDAPAPATSAAPTAPPIESAQPGEVSNDAPATPAEEPVSTDGGRRGKRWTDPNVAPIPATPTVPPPPPPESPFDTKLQEYQKIVDDWANGRVDDKVFRTSINRAVLSMGLNNAAERDALQMRINQDPSLRGQGAGQALLTMLGAQQNFNADQMFGQLAEDSQQRILDLQKYGVQEGMAINTQRRQLAFEDIETLTNAGQFGNAADLMTKTLGLAPGTIDADTLKAHDSFSLQQFGSQIQNIKDIATTDPAKAEALLTPLMSNPAFKDWFAPGVSAKDLINSIVTGDFQKNQAMISDLSTTINEQANSDTPFDQALANYKAMGPTTWNAFINTGKKMSIEDLNAARSAEGLSSWSKDAAGNIVDEKGNAVTDEDFAEAAAAADYERRQKKMQEAPWDTQYDIISKSPMFAEILKIPGADLALKNWLIASNLSTFKTDPSTGQTEPVGIFDDPKISFLFHQWPKAGFDADGNVTGTPYEGGFAYGEKINGQEVKPTADDETLNNKYAAYLRTNSGTPLSQKEWYFATAAGTKPPDASKIPAQYKTAPVEDHTQVGIHTGGVEGGSEGTVTDPGPGPNLTGPPKDSLAGKAEAYSSVINTLSSLPDNGKDSLISMGRDMLLNINQIPPGSKPDTKTNLSKDYNTYYREAVNRLAARGMTASQRETMVHFDQSSTNLLNAGETAGRYTGTPIFAAYANYVALLHGLPPKDAEAALRANYGDAIVKQVLALDAKGVK